MAYTRQYKETVGWENEPSVASPINATNLNQIDEGLLNVDKKVHEEFASVNNELQDKQDKLKFDSTPTSGSSNPVTSNGIRQALNNVKIAVDNSLSNTSTNPVQNKVVTAAIEATKTPIATTTVLGKVKVDGRTVKIKPDGTIYTDSIIDDVIDPNITVINGEYVEITWTDPDYLPSNTGGQLRRVKTRVVRKLASIPQNDTDGDIVVDEVTKNQYASTPLIDEGMFGTGKFYYRFFLYGEDVSHAGSYLVGKITNKIFGVMWDGNSSSALSRTDEAVSFVDPVAAVNNGDGSSPFDNFLPWNDMERIEDAKAGTLVRIPKYWYKWTRSGAVMKLQISDTEQDGFLVSPAHADRGDGNGERDYVYVGAYHCASDYKSKTGVLPLTTTAREDFRVNIHSLGDTIWQYDFAMYWTIMMLYLVEYADWNSQKKIGYGGSDSGQVEVSGLCDNMIYHTGTNAITRLKQGHVRYRWIEDLWANCTDYIEGIYAVAEKVYCIKNPVDFSTHEGGTLVGTIDTNMEGLIKAWKNPNVSGFEYALIPITTSEESDCTNYVCDYVEYYNLMGMWAAGEVGSPPRASDSCGIFRIAFNELDRMSNFLGSRLMKLPND